MDSKKLPIVKVPFRRQNVNWVPVYDDRKCINFDDAVLPVQIEDAEVLTLNLNSGTMRVRIINKDRYGTFDTDIKYFYDAYKIEGV